MSRVIITSLLSDQQENSIELEKILNTRSIVNCFYYKNNVGRSLSVIMRALVDVFSQHDVITMTNETLARSIGVCTRTITNYISVGRKMGIFDVEYVTTEKFPIRRIKVNYYKILQLIFDQLKDLAKEKVEEIKKSIFAFCKNASGKLRGGGRTKFEGPLESNARDNKQIDKNKSTKRITREEVIKLYAYVAGRLHRNYLDDDILKLVDTHGGREHLSYSVKSLMSLIGRLGFDYFLIENLAQQSY